MSAPDGRPSAWSWSWPDAWVSQDLRPFVAAVDEDVRLLARERGIPNLTVDALTPTPTQVRHQPREHPVPCQLCGINPRTRRPRVMTWAVDAICDRHEPR